MFIPCCVEIILVRKKSSGTETIPGLALLRWDALSLESAVARALPCSNALELPLKRNEVLVRI